MKTLNDVRNAIEELKVRSAWSKGVKGYALELLDDLDENITLAELDKETLLNGAESWKEYSWGGCSEIYNEDIAVRLCAPSELKKTRNGELKPNMNEEWLDVQASALNQAARRILRITRLLLREQERTN